MIYQGLVRRIYERNIYVPIMHLSMLRPREGGLWLWGLSPGWGFWSCDIFPGWEFDMATILDNEEGLEIYLLSKAFPSQVVVWEVAEREVSGTYIALLLCAANSKGHYFGHLYSPQRGGFWYFWPIMLSRGWGIWCIFSENVKIPRPSPLPHPGA